VRSLGLGSWLCSWPKFLGEYAVEFLLGQNDTRGSLTFGFENAISDDLEPAAALADAESLVPVAAAAVAITALRNVSFTADL